MNRIVAPAAASVVVGLLLGAAATFRWLLKPAFPRLCNQRCLKACLPANVPSVRAKPCR